MSCYLIARFNSDDEDEGPLKRVWPFNSGSGGLRVRTPYPEEYSTVENSELYKTSEYLTVFVNCYFKEIQRIAVNGFTLDTWITNEEKELTRYAIKNALADTEK